MVFPYIIVTQKKNGRLKLNKGNCGNMDCPGTYLSIFLKLCAIGDWRDYFFIMIMSKAIHRIAAMYLSDHIVIHFDVNS